MNFAFPYFFAHNFHFVRIGKLYLLLLPLKVKTIFFRDEVHQDHLNNWQGSISKDCFNELKTSNKNWLAQVLRWKWSHTQVCYKEDKFVFHQNTCIHSCRPADSNRKLQCWPFHQWGIIWTCFQSTIQRSEGASPITWYALFPGLNISFIPSYISFISFPTINIYSTGILSAINFFHQIIPASKCVHVWEFKMCSSN